jgi:hypothetical protein
VLYLPGLVELGELGELDGALWSDEEPPVVEPPAPDAITSIAMGLRPERLKLARTSSPGLSSSSFACCPSSCSFVCGSILSSAGGSWSRRMVISRRSGFTLATLPVISYRSLEPKSSWWRCCIAASSLLAATEPLAPEPLMEPELAPGEAELLYPELAPDESLPAPGCALAEVSAELLALPAEPPAAPDCDPADVSLEPDAPGVAATAPGWWLTEVSLEPLDVPDEPLDVPAEP